MVDIIVRPPRPVLRVRPSNWTSANVQLHGNPFSFGGREYLQPVYDSPWPKVFLKAGRQVEKTTTLCNTGMSELYCVPHTSALYVSSSSQQTSVFSTSVVKAMLMESPNLRGSWYRRLHASPC